ncbi:PH domain-containing protein [Streptosporangiaceae bacterium NEAU-GS5]|nr:PH domain-containing protein [Streptosporangiaceae bacterium NEAU-GS5]
MKEWRVPGAVIAAKAGAVLVFALLTAAGVAAGDGKLMFLAGVALVGAVVVVVRDLVAPVRLGADAEGVMVVSGFAARRRIAWPLVERIRLDTKRRYGLTTELLEIDTGDDIHLFSRFDLGEPAIDVAEALMRMRP